MIQIGVLSAALAILRNQAHRFIGGALRGGHRTMSWSEDDRRRHAEEIFSTVAPHIGSTAGQIGVEIGPGDNLDVCRRFVETGAQRMYAIERFAEPVADDNRIVFAWTEIEKTKLPEPIDFAFSNDVFEHVDNVPEAMTAIFSALRPGGRFVNSIDLRGHNVFNVPDRPLDFLTCPDWLWSLMFSHILTTNRVRSSEFVKAAQAAGFRVLKMEPLASADEGYVQEVRPHLLRRYKELPDDDLGILQLLLVLERPAAAT